MNRSIPQAFISNFLGNTPSWYKLTIITFLLINPVVWQISHFLAGWLLVIEFIFTLAMALRCYPLQPGGLLALEAVILGMTSSTTVYMEVANNLEVILLLIFMVAGIFYLKDMLLFVFTKILLGVRSKTMLSLLFVAVSAVLSAFLDALTVTAVVIAVAMGFFGVYHRVSSNKGFDEDHDHADDSGIGNETREDLERFRAFLRNLMMHAAVGTALGGVTTLVGDQQNLLIATVAGWDFVTFFIHMSHISMPVLAAGLLTTVAVEKLGWFGYGQKLPDAARHILEEYDRLETENRSLEQKAKIIAQALVALFLVVAFEFQLPFTALLVVFFGIVGVIHDQHLFAPIINYVFSLPHDAQAPMFYVANGVLSAISDNVFVATVYINEIKAALDAGTISREHFDALAVAVNTGTNIPSVATPNGQAAFLFLLTSALAPLIRLSYMRMVMLALPYTIIMSITGLLATIYLGSNA
jgi:NhaB family Na+:H+ antiporter